MALYKEMGPEGLRHLGPGQAGTHTVFHTGLTQAFATALAWCGGGATHFGHHQSKLFAACPHGAKLLPVVHFDLTQQQLGLGWQGTVGI